MNKTKTVILMGPTASGKTSLAVRLAEKTNGEIVSADSRQVYRHMDIGTGKDLDEYGDILYHLIDIIDPSSEFSVSDFQILALQALREISSKGKLPIICGGTGHYIKALVEDYDFHHQKTNLCFTGELENLPRKDLEAKIKSLGLWDQHHWHSDSKRRMVRAIEKKTRFFSESRPLPSFQREFNFRIYYMDIDRETIRKRITQRLNTRLEGGMIAEAKHLLKMGISHERLERFGLEYKYLSLHIRDKISLNEMVAKLSTEISRYAKRQMTFIRFMQRSGLHLTAISNFEEFYEEVSGWLEGSN